MSARPDSARAELPPIPLALPCAWGGPVGRGVARVGAEDFQVVEIPLATPSGEGEHSWLYVRKRNANTQWVARQLARYAGVPGSAVSYAGLKDRNAVTEQWFSVHLPGRQDPDWRALACQDVEILEAQRHTRKLRTGTLRGNRFRLVVRDVDADRVLIEQRLAQVRAGGFPNAFGPQRFGHDGANLQAAARLLQDPRARVPRDKRSIYLSAVRAALFNRVLAARIADASWNRALPGEALQLEGKSACFVANEVDADILARLAALEIHPTGPLCGDGEPLAVGAAAQYESELLQTWEGWIAALRRFRLVRARRALRALAGDLTWHSDNGRDWTLAFSLPAGAYATSLLHEVFELDDNAAHGTPGE